MVEEGGMYEGVLGREYGRGGWMMIRDEIASIERVEHNTTIGNNVMNEYCIEDF